MQLILRRRALFGLLLAGLLASLEVAWEPWHIYSDHHFDAAEIDGHANTRGFHSHADEHDEDNHDKHEHHSVVEHQQNFHPGRVQAPVVVEAAVVLIEVVPVDVPELAQIPADLPTLPANESPPDRRLSQRGPPRA